MLKIGPIIVRDEKGRKEFIESYKILDYYYQYFIEEKKYLFPLLLFLKRGYFQISLRDFIVATQKGAHFSS